MTEFFEALGRYDFAAAAELVDENAVYTNVPMPPAIVGRDAIKQTCEGLFTLAHGLKMIIRDQIQDGEIVMNRRSDTWTWNRTGIVINLEIMGYFVVKNGLITVWTDYYDEETTQTAKHLKLEGLA
ncbi:nuclear transport factor 2 family protein [Amycolatopsis sp. cg5]|uniref:nuclear transport factor 2 family protein n=1 Tax=Amycolatopsis sp. cg5 TaxID=3238802 RepID=UPI00352406D9